jgi:colanic acid/amylovoran biosynthesis glycosyltransferase
MHGSQPATATRPMKIAYVVSRFPKLTETFILQEILAMRRLGVEIELYPLLYESTDVEQPDVAQLRSQVRILPLLSIAIVRSNLGFLWAAPGRYLATLEAVIRGTAGSANYLFGALAYFLKAVHAAGLMRESAVDHIHCHFASHPALVGYIINRLTDIPYSFTAHGSDLHRDRHMLCSKVSRASFVAAISRYNHNVIAANCGSEAAARVVVVHCGVDTSAFAPAGHRAPGARLAIVCVGALHAVKGQRHLIEACRLLAARGISFICYFVGDGPDRRALERQAALAELSDSVVFLGAQTSDTVAKLLQRCDVLVAPSVPTRKGRREGIPVVLMEAMASGLPVVASRLSGIPELVEHQRTGLLVRPGDAAAIAECVTRLANDEALRGRLVAAGREKVELEFETNRSAARLVELFRAAGRPAASDGGP